MPSDKRRRAHDDSPKAAKRSKPTRQHISNSEKKSQSQKPTDNPPKAPKEKEENSKHIYIATEETYGPYEKTVQNIFEAYTSVQDANQRLLARTTRRHVAHLRDCEWETRYDEFGCYHAKAESLEGDGARWHVRRLELRPEGAAVEDEDESEGGFGVGGEEYYESEGQSLDGELGTP